MYRSKEWCKSARRMDKKKKKSSWLGTYKSCIFVPPTPGSELRRLLQKKEIEMRPGGREDWPIKIVETAGKSLERCLVTADPFHGNKCSDKSCLPARNENNKISCRRNNVGYRVPCKLCQKAGESDGAVFTDSALWAGSVIESPCPSVCLFVILSVPSGAVFLERSSSHHNFHTVRARDLKF